jgi:hypothetical protein
MYGGASLRPDVTPTGVVAHAPRTLAPSRWRRAPALVGQIVARAATFVGGYFAGQLFAIATGGKFLPEEIALDLGMAITIAIWVTAGRAWLQPRKWPRLFTVFAIAAGVWLFVLSPIVGYLLTLPYR